MFNFKSKQKNSVDLTFIGKRHPLWKPILLLVPAFAVIIIFTIIPFIISMNNTFIYLPNKHDKSITEFGFQNWTKLFDDPFYLKSIKNSVLYAFISVPLVLVISAIVSAVIASVGRKWLRGFFQTIFFLPYVTSVVAISLAFVYLFDLDNGLLNSLLGTRYPWLKGEPDSNYALWAMIIFGTWRGLAFNILIFTTAMLGVDKNLYKSASIDGASSVRQFFTITIPSIRRTLNFLLTIGIIGAIKVFPLALFQNDPGEAINHGGGSLLLYVFDAVKDGNIQKAAVSSVVLLLVSISFSVIFKNVFSGIVNLATYIGDKNVSSKIKIKNMMR